MKFLENRNWGERSTDAATPFLERRARVKRGTGIALGSSGLRHPREGASIRARLGRGELAA